jgi:hypothetical protein
MRRLARFISVVVAVSGVCATVSSCKSDGRDNSTSATLGFGCSGPTDCSRDESCAELVGATAPYSDMRTSVCTKPCASNGDCVGSEEIVCGVLADGSRGCLPSCVRDSDVPCLDGVPTACAAAGPTACEKCGCAPGERCEVGVGCEPLRAIGEACEVDLDCKTANCSAYSKVCRVPVGQNCDASNCDICLSSSSGWSYCSRPCQRDDECSTAGRCVGYADTNNFSCRPNCKSISDSSCPGTCKYTSNTAALYCDCPNCNVSSPKRPYGAGCSSSSSCESGNCISRGWTINLQYNVAGFCSQSCKGDADCSANSGCVEFACESSSADSQLCGMHCAPRCEESNDCADGSTCHSMKTVSGAESSLCDPRFLEGRPCQSNFDCISLRCGSDSMCMAASGKLNGAGCLTSSECASANCVGGKCRGLYLIGDACASTYDCSVGCCSSSRVCLEC